MKPPETLTKTDWDRVIPHTFTPETKNGQTAYLGPKSPTGIIQAVIVPPTDPRLSYQVGYLRLSEHNYFGRTAAKRHVNEMRRFIKHVNTDTVFPGSHH